MTVDWIAVAMDIEALEDEQGVVSTLDPVQQLLKQQRRFAEQGWCSSVRVVPVVPEHRRRDRGDTLALRLRRAKLAA